MQEPIEVYVEICDGTITDVRTSLATEGGVKVTIIQFDEGDTDKETAEYEKLAEEACDRCPNFVDW